MDFSMECLEFVYGTLDGYLCFCMGKSNHKPIFMNLGLKEPYLVYFPIVIQTREFLADFKTLPFREFDLIMGMDWLTKHRAIIDCGKKTVVLR